MNTQKSVSRFEERTLADFTAYFRASNVERPSRLNSVCDMAQVGNCLVCNLDTAGAN